MDTTSINQVKVSEFFYLGEFQCPCCLTVRISPQLLEACEKLRQWRGSPVYITSGYRCWQRNLIVGGSLKSRHLSGEAIDTAMTDIKREEALEPLQECGFNGILYYPSQRRWHLDVREGKPYIDLYHG